MINLYKAFCMAIKAAYGEWRYVRYLQNGGNPDQSWD